MGAPRTMGSSRPVLHVVVLADDVVCDEFHPHDVPPFAVPKDEQDEVAAWVISGALLGALVGWLLESILVGVGVAPACIPAGLLIYLARARPRDARSISIGSSVKNDVAVFGASAPIEHTLFDFRQGAYFLDVPMHARGKLSLGKRAATVEQLRRKFGRADRLRIRLDPRAKGKLQVGDCTILFQFSPPKPAKIRLPFPLDLKPTFEQMFSRREQISLAVSLAVLGSYFFWLATAEVTDEFDIDDIDERFVVAMGIQKEKPEPEETKEEDELAQEDEEKEEDKKDEPKPEPKLDKKLDKQPEKFSEAAMKQARNVGIARVLGTYGGPGEGTVLDVIESTENNLGDLFAQGMTQTVLADGGDITP